MSKFIEQRNSHSNQLAYQRPPLHSIYTAHEFQLTIQAIQIVLAFGIAMAKWFLIPMFQSGEYQMKIPKSFFSIQINLLTPICSYHFTDHIGISSMFIEEDCLMLKSNLPIAITKQLVVSNAQNCLVHFMNSRKICIANISLAILLYVKVFGINFFKILEIMIFKRIRLV